MRPSVLALIPARAGSKRAPGKNARMLGGKPLVRWTLDDAIAAKGIGRVLVSTDDQAVSEVATAAGVDVLVRPADLAGDHVTSVDVAIHAIAEERAAGREWDVLCLLQPTSPFRAEGRVDAGLGLLAASPEADAVVGVSAPSHHPAHCLLEDGGRLVPATELGARSQDLPRAWALTGSFYAIRVEALEKHRSFLPPVTLPLACDAPGEGIDIDWPEDFEAAERHLQGGQTE